MLRVVELFAGIGAQAAALDHIGAEWKSVGIVEIDPYCVTAYNAIHGTDYKPSDITKVERLPECDLLTYSFPLHRHKQRWKTKGVRRGKRNAEQPTVGGAPTAQSLHQKWGGVAA